VRTSLLGRLLAALIIASGLGLAPMAPATSAPGAPTGLTPNQTSLAGLPVLSWNRVSSADSYDVQVSGSATFDNLLWSTATYNRRATPNIQLPAGQTHWRVRSRDDSGASQWSSASFSRSALSGPAAISPPNGAQLNPPEEAALIAWQPINGATQYTLEVSTDSQFVNPGAIKTYTTQTSSYVVPDPVVATTYHWRVRASLGSGVVTEWSATQSYGMGGLEKPVLVSPDNSAQAAPIRDVVLDWEPVLGAHTYNLQISTDRNFNTIDDARQGVVSTRYSPPVTLNNDQYYWRVTPVDVAGNKLDWAQVDVWEFRRNWPFQPQLEYPAANALVGDPFYYQWSPVRHASSYRLEVARNTADFSQNNIFDVCSTVNTTFVPTGDGDCFPQAQGTYYWRVIGIDSPRGVVSEAVASPAQRFTYDPAYVTPTSPISNASVEIPTLRWEPLPGANQYDIVITNVANGQTYGTRTYGTSWTPTSVLPVGETFRWQVRSVSSTGRLGPNLTTASQPRFTTAASSAVTGAYPEPLSTGAPSDRFPTLQWSPATGATRYEVFVRPQGTILWRNLNVSYPYPAGEDTSMTWLTPDTYEWRVEAWSGNTFLAQSSSPGLFVVAASETVTGHRVALSGTASADPTVACTKSLDPSLPLSETQCTGMGGTPVLRWDAKPNVGRYVVWISRDQQLTNLVGDRTYPTEQAAFVLPTALIDSQAGSAFYWHVQPCKLPGTCKAPQPAGHAFNKISNPVQLVSPADGLDVVVSNDITFTWQDYLCTNQGVQEVPATPLNPCRAGAPVDPDVEAQSYRIEVDDEPNFQSPIDSVVVDQTTYTAFGSTYPEGPLYWRVQAIDGSGNALTWSDGRTLMKRSPTVTLSAPVSNTQTSGSAPLRWEPLAYSSSYDVEVYKNADTIGQAANLVYSGNSRQVALSRPVPFAVSSASYTWRVRPRDASGRPGQWTGLGSETARFRVVGTAPQQTAPADGSLQQAKDVMFTWNGVEGATDYRVERRLVGGGGEEHVRTPGLAWAPSIVGDGRWEWRVLALDSVGAEIGASPWWRFTVDQTAPAVSTVKPVGIVKRGANFTVVFSEPVNDANRNTVKIMPSGSTRKLSAVVKPSDDRTKAVLNPDDNLRRGRSYTIRVTSKITDDAGNQLTAYSWTVTAQ
jgi:hypothetical protein